MQHERWAKVKKSFDAVILLAAEDRAAYLSDTCGEDVELRREVESLLQAFTSADDFLETPFAGEIADDLFSKDVDDELKPGELFGRYKISRKIGAGGMGQVYLAEDGELKRSVAIKLLSCTANLDPAQVSRFVQEARLASLLNHPNILTIYEIGHEGDKHFISTEFVPGETLREHMAREPLNPRRAVNIAIDIASALVLAHRAEIVHRDIKPENVMIREDGLLKVLDFGVAKLSRLVEESVNPWTEDVRTDPGFILGTPAYMSPEQALGLEVDEQTDIWSLGVILYEMIAGRPPFDGTSPGEIVRSVLHDEPKPLTHISPDIQSSLRKIVKKAVHKIRDERYQSMEEFLADLRSLRTEVETGNHEPRSIAILPFRNLKDDGRYNFFQFALADALITELGKTSGLIVRPSGVMAKYLGSVGDPFEIGRELRADAILSANFVVSNERIRVTAQLIDVNDKKVLWSEQIDSCSDDIITLQDAITIRIVDGLKGELATRALPSFAVPATQNSLAYLSFLRGRDQLRRYMFHTVANENIEIAIEHFERAIELDPKFAMAYCGLGICYLQKILKIVGGRSDLEKASDALDRALELDSYLTEARAYRSLVMRAYGDVESARRVLAELRRNVPNNFEVQYLSAMGYRLDGDYDRAFECYRRMLQIDPTAQVGVHYCRARIFLFRGEFGLAINELKAADKIEPNHPTVKFFRAITTFRMGDAASAAQQIRTLFETYPCKGFRPYLAICLAALGEHDAALAEITQEIEEIAKVDPDVSYWIASAYIMTGRVDLGLEWLERSVGLSNRDFAWFDRDPLLLPVRKHPRYLALVSRLKLAAAS